MAITLVGVGGQTSVDTSSSSTAVATLPAGVQEDDDLFILVLHRSSNGAAAATATGYTELAYNNPDSGSGGNRVLTVLHKRAGASESNPTVTFANNSTGAAGSVQMIAYRGVDDTNTFDVTEVDSNQNTTSTTWTPTGITTSTNGAVVVSFVGTNDNNALDLDAGNEQGFTARMSGGDYDTTFGNDGSVGVADKTIASAGAVTCPTWEQTVNGADRWTGITFALRPAPTGTTYNETGRANTVTFTVARTDSADFVETGRANTVAFTVDSSDTYFPSGASFPTVESSSTGNSGSSLAEETTVTFPAGSTTGDLVVVAVASDGAETLAPDTPSGWSNAFLVDASQHAIRVFYREFTGSEGSSMVLTHEFTKTAWIAYRISGHDSTNPIGGVAFYAESLATSSPDPPSLDTGTSRAYLWLAGYTCDGPHTPSSSSAPTGYSGHVSEASGSSYLCGVELAWNKVSAQTEDPGTFTMDSGEQWTAFTIAITPSGVGGNPIERRSVVTSFTIEATDNLGGENDETGRQVSATFTVSNSSTLRSGPAVLASTARVAPDYEVVLVSRSNAEDTIPTFTQLGPLPWTSLRWGDELNREGSAEIDVNTSALSDSLKTQLQELHDTPSEVWVYRNDQMVWAGPLVAIQGNDDRSVRLVCRGLLYYYRYQHLVDDQVFAAVEQLTIARTLAEYWADTFNYGNFGIDTSLVDNPLSNIFRDRTYLAADIHNIYDRLIELAEVEEGFDLWVEPESRLLRTAYPNRGTNRASTVYLDDRTVQDPSIVLSVQAGDIASEVWMVGAAPSENEPPITSHQSNNVPRAKFGATSVAGTQWNVTVQATLDDYANAALQYRDEALLDPAASMRPVPSADVDDFDVGDTVTFAIDIGLGLTETARRVASKFVSFNASTGDEQIEVTFV